MIGIFKKSPHFGTKKSKVEFNITIKEVKFTQNDYFMKNSTFSLVVVNEKVDEKVIGGKITFFAPMETSTILINDNLNFATTLYYNDVSKATPAKEAPLNSVTPQYLPKERKLVLRQTFMLVGEELVHHDLGFFVLHLDKIIQGEPLTNHAYEINDSQVKVTIQCQFFYKQTPLGTKKTNSDSEIHKVDTTPVKLKTNAVPVVNETEETLLNDNNNINSTSDRREGRNGHVAVHEFTDKDLHLSTLNSLENNDIDEDEQVPPEKIYQRIVANFNSIVKETEGDGGCDMFRLHSGNKIPFQEQADSKDFDPTLVQSKKGSNYNHGLSPLDEEDVNINSQTPTGSSANKNLFSSLPQLLYRSASVTTPKVPPLNQNKPDSPPHLLSEKEEYLKTQIMRILHDRDEIVKDKNEKESRLSQLTSDLKSLRGDIYFLKTQLKRASTASSIESIRRGRDDEHLRQRYDKLRREILTNDDLDRTMVKNFITTSQKSISNYNISFYSNVDANISNKSIMANSISSSTAMSANTKLRSLDASTSITLRRIKSSLKESYRRVSLVNMRKLNHETKLPSEIMLYPLVNPALAIPENLTEWDFDVLEINDGLVLCNIVGRLFEMLIPFQELNIETSILARFIMEVAKHYHDRPFHNLQHATCVTHFTFMLINATKAMDNLKLHQIFGILLAALVHDVDHPGNTNLFEINTNSELALRYNDQSVLENHHCSTAFRLINQPKMQVLAKVPPTTATEIRRIIISCVMATDIAVHFDLIEGIKKTAEDGWDYNQVKQQEFMGKILVHASDLSNPVRPFHMAKKWAERISIEFNDQVSKEQSLGLPVLGFMMTPDEKAFCRNETGFAAYVVAPMWRNIAVLYPNLQFLVDQLDGNLTQYKSWLESITIEDEQKEIETKKNENNNNNINKSNDNNDNNNSCLEIRSESLEETLAAINYDDATSMEMETIKEEEATDDDREDDNDDDNNTNNSPILNSSK